MAIYTGASFGLQLCEALGLDPGQTGRIIVDVPPTGAIKVYVEMYASEKVLDLDWSKGLQGAEITVLDKE
jgi:hypothetical protein